MADNKLPSSFCTEGLSIDPAEPWINLCRNPDDPYLSYFQNFLTYYVERSAKALVVCDEREVADKLTVTSVSSLISVWRVLVAAANEQALSPNRRKELRGEGLTLKWNSKDDVKQGPAYCMVQVSSSAVSDRMCGIDGS